MIILLPILILTIIFLTILIVHTVRASLHESRYDDYLCQVVKEKGEPYKRSVEE